MYSPFRKCYPLKVTRKSHHRSLRSHVRVFEYFSDVLMILLLWAGGYVNFIDFSSSLHQQFLKPRSYSKLYMRDKVSLNPPPPPPPPYYFLTTDTVHLVGVYSLFPLLGCHCRSFVSLHRCPSCGTFTSTTSKIAGRSPLSCFVCGKDLPPGCPYNRKISTACDKKGGSPSRPTTDYFHTDGESCRPCRIEDDASCDCNDCDARAVFDLSGQGVEEFCFCEPCFFSQRASVLRAGVAFEQRNKNQVSTGSAYRSASASEGSPQSANSVRGSPQSASSPASARGAGSPQHTGSPHNAVGATQTAKSASSSRGGKGKRARVD